MDITGSALKKHRKAIQWLKKEHGSGYIFKKRTVNQSSKSGCLAGMILKKTSGSAASLILLIQNSCFNLKINPFSAKS
jgi:hypothetical protein